MKKVIFNSILMLSACSSQHQLPGAALSFKEPPIEETAAYKNIPKRKTANEAPTKYKISGSCDGLPRIDVKTAPGFCVGLLFDGAQKFKKSRWAAPVGNKSALITDMGGWDPFQGAIYQIDFQNGAVNLRTVLSTASFALSSPVRGILDKPNQISLGKDGKYYVGSAGGIYRFDLKAPHPAESVEEIIARLPNTGLHPLKTFAFDNEQNIYVNVGSFSNVCQNYTSFANSDPKMNPENFRRNQFPNCPEAEDLKNGRGQIRRYLRTPEGKYEMAFSVFALGLRNSIALTWDEKNNYLIEGDNGRDAVEKFDPTLDANLLPHEKINLIKNGGKHFGWPYCYDDGRNNPEWKNVNCAAYEKPSLLIPAHSSPLGMIQYRGDLFPSFYRGRLLLSLHGYEPMGHRLVTFLSDENGVPTGVPQSIVFDWEKRGTQGKGKPVGLAEMPDGSVLIVEDEPQNKILRLYYDRKEGNGTPIQEIDIASSPSKQDQLDEEVRKSRMIDKLRDGNVPPFTVFENKVIDRVCYSCHQATGAPGVQLLRYDDIGNEKRILTAGMINIIAAALKGNSGVPAMPPQGWDSPTEKAEALDLLNAWIKANHQP